jgi:hypothetical protein
MLVMIDWTPNKQHRPHAKAITFAFAGMAAVAAVAAMDRGEELTLPMGLDRQVFLQEINDPSILARDVLAPATMKAIGISSVILLENGIVAEADTALYPDLQENIDRLYELDTTFRALTPFGVNAADDDSDLDYQVGVIEAQAGKWSVAELDAMASTIVALDDEFKSRANEAVFHMELNSLTLEQAAETAMRTRVVMATGGPEMMPMNPDLYPAHVLTQYNIVGDVWGGLSDQLSSLREFTTAAVDEPEMALNL